MTKLTRDHLISNKNSQIRCQSSNMQSETDPQPADAVAMNIWATARHPSLPTP